MSPVPEIYPNDTSASILVRLERLRRDVEKTFPEARGFIRPGFDQPNSKSSTPTL